MNNKASTKEYWQITKTEYESRFNKGRDRDASVNFFGYGAKKRYVPPLYKPKTIYAAFEKQYLNIL